MKLDKIINFAKEQGYETAEYIGKWKNYDLYEPVFSTEAEVSYIGLPFTIMVKGDLIRMSTVDEAFEQLND